jgi:1,4-dihydroxy-2-naphthoate octaprenyltransferase
MIYEIMKLAAVWLKAARLKLHIIGILPVLVGSLIAFNRTGNLKVVNLAFAGMITLLVLIATAFGNDYADAETDRLNRGFNIFSGGSRVIPDGLITTRQMLVATTIASALSIILSIVFIIFLKGHLFVLILNFIGLLIGAGYSLPPFKINYRGFGELLVMFMYGPFSVFFGYTTQLGPVIDAKVLYLSLIPALATFLMILVTEIPDSATDRISGKKTIPSVFGDKAALIIYALGVVILYATVQLLNVKNVIGKIAFSGLLLSLPLGAYLVAMSLSKESLAPKKILSLCAATFILTVWVNVVLTVDLALISASME